MDYVDDLLFRDESASTAGPGNDKYLHQLVLPPNHPTGSQFDEFGLEFPKPSTHGQDTFSSRDMPEPSLELWQQEPLSMDHWMATPRVIGDVSGRERLSDSVSLDRSKPPVLTQARNNRNRPQGEPLDFLDTIRFFCESSNHCQGNLLNIQASSDKDKLFIILGNIEELGRKTAAAVVREPGVACPSGGGSRQDQYIRMLTRVAVMGAVEIADDLLQYDLKIQNITPSGIRDNVEVTSMLRWGV